MRITFVTYVAYVTYAAYVAHATLCVPGRQGRVLGRP
jgi:hypothetical protein